MRRKVVSKPVGQDQLTETHKMMKTISQKKDNLDQTYQSTGYLPFGQETIAAADPYKQNQMHAQTMDAHYRKRLRVERMKMAQLA